MQIVKIESGDNLAYYVGDIIPLDAKKKIIKFWNLILP